MLTVPPACTVPLPVNEDMDTEMGSGGGGGGLDEPPPHPERTAADAAVRTVKARPVLRFMKPPQIPGLETWGLSDFPEARSSRDSATQRGMLRGFRVRVARRSRKTVRIAPLGFPGARSSGPGEHHQIVPSSPETYQLDVTAAYTTLKDWPPQQKLLTPPGGRTVSKASASDSQALIFTTYPCLGPK
jgi:hypothetical protein